MLIKDALPDWLLAIGESTTTPESGRFRSTCPFEDTGNYTLYARYLEAGWNASCSFCGFRGGVLELASRHYGIDIESPTLSPTILEEITEFQKPSGEDGLQGWSPIPAAVEDGARRVIQIVDWTGGGGDKPATGQYVGPSGLVSNIASATDIRGVQGIQGDEGDPGEDGWSPVFSVVSDGERRVLQVIDWTGGTGTKPTTGLYVGASGLVASIASGVDVRGGQGAQGAAGDGGVTFNFSTDTTNSDPGSGYFKYNNASAAFTSNIYISESDLNSVDVSAWLAFWDDANSTTERGQIMIRAGSSKIHVFSVRAAITDNGSWLTIPVTFVSAVGTLSNAEASRLLFTRTGAQGLQGPIGYTSRWNMTAWTSGDQQPPASGVIAVNGDIGPLGGASVLAFSFTSADGLNFSDASNGIFALLAGTNTGVGQGVFIRTNTLITLRVGSGVAAFRVTGDITRVQPFVGSVYCSIPVARVVEASLSNATQQLEVSFFSSGPAGTAGSTIPMGFQYDRGANGASPGAGGITFDNDAPGSCTTIRVFNQDANTQSTGTFFSNLKTGDTLYVNSQTTSASFAVVSWTFASQVYTITVNSGLGVLAAVAQRHGVSIGVSGLPGGWVLLATQTASASANLTFDNVFSTTYDTYAIAFSDIAPATNATDLRMRLRTSAPVDVTGTYSWGIAASAVGSAVALSQNGSTLADNGVLATNISSSGAISGILFIQPRSTVHKTWWGQLMISLAGNSVRYVYAPGGFLANTTAQAGVRFLFSSGNIASGTIRIYGLRAAL